jgi:hypothetical protein
MVPAALPPGDVADRVQRIDRPGVGGARGGNDQPGAQAGGAVGGDVLGQRVRPPASIATRRTGASASPAIRSAFSMQ